MKSIDRKYFITAGVVAKTHGTRGEIKITLSEDVKFSEWAFLEIQGKPVPFYIENIMGTGDDPVLKLEGVSDPEEASKLVGHNVLFPKPKRKKRSLEIDESLTGYLLIDSVHGEIGTIDAIEELPQQALFQLIYRGKEILVPAIPAFVSRIDEEKRIIFMDLPEGLLEI